ncbi:uncharacterized protein LOC136074474 [Hydra vulgaris]|uniref:Uncharacterized protein LOC136074474 n=1 Tax=Hydra vulgaris TaxID=6087 RepID=A0ABM4B227_HYDVU
MQEYHKGKFSTETYEFSSESKFLTWKEKEEINNYVFFSKQTGSKQSSKETKTSYFICQVDGHSKPHRSAKEPPRKKNKRYFRGSVKSDAFCPARMIVNMKKNGTTNVLNQVYHDLRESFGERENRVNGDNIVLTKSNLLTKKNISDITRVIKKGCQLHPDDSTSTYLLVQKLMCEEFNSILVYKPQGQPAIIGPKVYDDIDINKDLFVIAIQTKQHCYTNIALIKEIKKRCTNPVKVNAVMTDDDCSSWNAFSKVFGDKHHLLCKWHVKRAWCSKLHLVGTAHLQEEIYQILETMIDEKDPIVFTSIIYGFVKTYEKICPNFINYLVTYYASRHKKWASSFRNFQHADTNTNMLLESFHNKLKTVYIDRRPNKRLDNLIKVLLKIEEDDYWRHKRGNIYLGTISP